MDYIISIEQLLTGMSVHLIKYDCSKMFTFLIDTIYNKKELEIIENCAITSDYTTLISFFKKKYNLDHCTIRISWGYLIRNKIKNNQRNKPQGGKEVWHKF